MNEIIRKKFSCLLIFLFFLPFIGCNLGSKTTPVDLELEQNSDVGQYFNSPELVSFNLSLTNNDILVDGTLTLDLSCDNVFSTAASGDWSMESISATTTVSLVQGKACSITVSEYFDGIDTFLPVGSPLIITIASNGAVSTTSAMQYTNGVSTPILQWFAAAQGVSLYSIVINFTNDVVSGNSSLTPSNLVDQTVTLSVADVTAPTVSSLFVYNIPAMNSVAASYTLVASVSGTTGCKYIDNSSSTYAPTSWLSVNTAYTAVGAQACPVFVPGELNFTVGNWTSLWSSGIKTLIMWANTVNGLTSYTTANIGP